MWHSDDDVQALEIRIQYLEKNLRETQMSVRDEFFKAAISGLAASWSYLDMEGPGDLVDQAMNIANLALEKRRSME